MGWHKTSKNSKYFVGNGDNVSTCTCVVGNVRLIPEKSDQTNYMEFSELGTIKTVCLVVYTQVSNHLHIFNLNFVLMYYNLNVTNEHDMYSRILSLVG